MPEMSQMGLFFVAALLLAVTPGPGIFYVAARTLSGGRGEGIASGLGTGMGGMVHVFAGGLGLSALVLASAELFTILKWIGAAYLVWLGMRTLKSAYSKTDAALDLQAPPVAANTTSAFREGFLVEALNPKTAAFFLAFVPQFITPNGASIMVQFIVLGSISVALNTLADFAVVFAAHHIRHYSASRPASILRFRKLSGLTMIALGLGLAAAETRNQ
jgi:threonine/homoserine/homoserine lactone efflux protein